MGGGDRQGTVLGRGRRAGEEESLLKTSEGERGGGEPAGLQGPQGPVSHESLFTRRPSFTPTEGRQEGGRVAGPRIGVRSPRGSPVREQCFL